MPYHSGTIRSLLLQLTPFSPLRLAATALTRLFDGLARRQAQMRERESLLAMNERQLKDVGLSRADVLYEASKSNRCYY